MARHNELGKKGEEIAVKFLEKEGYLILERNFRYDKAEVDIIAGKGNLLVFTEVKSRSDYPLEDPVDSIRGKKESLLVKAADHYLDSFPGDCEARFDIITVFFRPGKVEVMHYPGAFIPGEGNEY